jgi:hypothetical protein
MTRFSGVVATVLLALVSVGCSGGPPKEPAPPTADEGDAHTGHAHQAGDSQSEAARAALAGLVPSDRESAERQRICPVSGELLGSMGEPVKLDVQGREVWICCAGCEGTLRENPEQYFAKLKE